MLTRAELRRISRARLADAKALFRAKRYDGAAYLCGYAIEVALKARICKTLRWTEFPSTNKGFEGLASFKVHNLEILLRLSGRETFIRANHTASWSVIASWNPESRYNRIGTTSRIQAETMIQETETILGVL